MFNSHLSKRKWYPKPLSYDGCTAFWASNHPAKKGYSMMEYSPIKPGKSTFYHGTKNRWECKQFGMPVFFGNQW